MTTFGTPTTYALGNLRIGAASAPTQIEGGDVASNWRDFADRPDTIKDATSPRWATGHWERWRQDTALLGELGLQIYRLGIDWARLEPRPGVFDEDALAHYRAEISAIRALGVEPLVTLHHFANPSWFEALGAWEEERSVELWLRFVRFAVGSLEDLVTQWCTVNEPNVYAGGGYVFGQFPPGRSGAWPALRRVMRHLAIAHCRAYKLIHDLQPAAQVGFAHHLRDFAPLNPRNPAHRALARANRYIFQDALSDAMLGGRFPKVLGRQPREVTPGPHYDYLGINYYSRTAVSKLADGRFPDVPVSDLDWEIWPAGLVRVARDLHEKYPGPIWVTENGTCDTKDSFRARFLHDHLGAMVGSGLPFERYYHWCLVDNWEWAEGQTAPFGLVHLNWETHERTIKDSGRFLAGVIAARGVTQELYDTFVAGQSYQVR